MFFKKKKIDTVIIQGFNHEIVLDEYMKRAFKVRLIDTSNEAMMSRVKLSKTNCSYAQEREYSISIDNCRVGTALLQKIRKDKYYLRTLSIQGVLFDDIEMMEGIN